MVEQVVRAILERNNKVLFLERNQNLDYPNKLTLPGGKRKETEEAKSALEREVKEETNLEIQNTEFLFYLSNNREGTRFLQHYYKADFTGKIKLNKEHATHHWLSPEELQKYPITSRDDEAVKKYIEN